MSLKLDRQSFSTYYSLCLEQRFQRENDQYEQLTMVVNFLVADQETFRIKYEQVHHHGQRARSEQAEETANSKKGNDNYLSL
jgi:hypothetical protein